MKTGDSKARIEYKNYLLLDGNGEKMSGSLGLKGQWF